MKETLYENGPPVKGRLLRAGVIYHASLDGGCRAHDAATGRELWCDWDPTPRAGLRYSKLRMFELWPEVARIWLDTALGIVACLGRDGPGLKVVARRTDSGAYLWTRSFPYSPCLPNLQTLLTDDEAPEQCWGRFVGINEALVVALDRKRNTELHLRSDAEAEPVPQCRLELTRLDPSSGQALWSCAYDNLAFSLVQLSSYAGCHNNRGRYSTFDWATGEQRTLLEVDALRFATPQRIGDRIVCCWYKPAALHTAVLDHASGRQIAASELRCKRPRAIYLLTDGRRVLVNLYRDRYALLGDGLLPLTEVKVPGWYRSMRCLPDGNVELTTEFNTACLDGRTGQLLQLTRLPRPNR